MKRPVVSFLTWSGCLALIAGFAMLGLGAPDVQSRKDVEISRGFAETGEMLPLILLLYAGATLLPVYFWQKRLKAAAVQAELANKDAKIRRILGQPPLSRE